MGWYNLFINNKRIDKTAFAPGWTAFKQRVQYQTYDITKYVDSVVSLKVDLGEGWSGGSSFGWADENIFPCYPISLNYEIKLWYEDGSLETLVSDESVDVTSNEVEYSTIYGGETQNSLYKEESLGKAKHIDINTEIIPQEGEDIVFGERIKPIKMWKAPNGDTLIDFGQNFAGIIIVRIKGHKGDKITYKPAETLDKDGNFYDKNYRGARSIYSFTLNGKKQILKPRFSFLGGRYIKLIEYPKYVDIDCFEAVLIHSNMKQTCFFKCGNEKIQRLYLNTYYGQLSNYIDIPTDCPQRDERLGWTGDAQVFFHTGAIHFDVYKFFKKWLKDMMLEQRKDGAINMIVPRNYRNPKDDAEYTISCGWSDAATVIPYEMFLSYGDKDFLKDCLPLMQKWIGYYLSKCSDSYIPKLDFSFGDWLALDKVQDGVCEGLTRFDLLNTAYFAYGTKLIIKSMEYLSLDHHKYDELYENIKRDYQKTFIKDGHMVGEKALLFSNIERTAYTQTGLAITLWFGLCKKEDKASLTNDLVNLIHECGDKLSTGFLGTPYLLYALSDNNCADIAYSLLFEEGYPSWLYSVNKGATTMWEHYDSIKEDGSFWYESMNSFNHYAYGSVFGWIFNNSVGINIVEPSYKEIIIKPLIDKRLGYVDCLFKTKYGKIKVYWNVNSDNKVSYKISVPKGIKATIELDDGFKKTFTSGGTLKR